MVDAKQMKLKWYGTDILSHDPTVKDSGSKVRATNTFKSSIMSPPPEKGRGRSPDRIF